MKIKGQVLRVETGSNKKTGEVFGEVSMLSEFLSFGSIKPEVLNFRIPVEKIKDFEEKIGKEIEVFFDGSKPQFLKYK